jgi:hypothetical protein
MVLNAVVPDLVATLATRRARERPRCGFSMSHSARASWRAHSPLAEIEDARWGGPLPLTTAS